MIQLKKKDTLKVDEKILAAKLTDEGHCIYVTASGKVYRYVSGQTFFLFDIEDHLDLEAELALFCLEDIVVVANAYKTKALVFYPGKYLHVLAREDYHADISFYPIALYKNEQDDPLMIWSAAWNRLHVMDLNSLTLLTAHKSLVDLHMQNWLREQDRTRDEPPVLDYFYGQLLLAPDRSRFLSLGWVWGSRDMYLMLDTGDFIHNPDIAYEEVFINNCDHNGRPVCWINDELLCMGYNPVESGDLDYKQKYPAELVLVNVERGRAGGYGDTAIVRRFPFEGFTFAGEKLYYAPLLNLLVAWEKEKGLTLCDLEGNIAWRDKEFILHNYSEKSNLMCSLDYETISFYEIIQVEG